MSEPTGRWNRPPNWPAPPSADWTPPPGWKPDPKWGNPPKGWQFYGPGGNAPVNGMALKKSKVNGMALKKSKTELRIALALGVILLVGIISAASGGNTSTTTTATATATATDSTAVPAAPVSESPALAPPAQAATARADQDAASKAAAAQAAAAKAAADPASACLMRPAQYGDLILRVSDPGVPPTAQVLGGGWAYNHDTNTCQNGPDFLLAGVAPGDGHCGQVATAASNPGYNADTSPAPLLSVVLVSKGNCDAPVAAAPASCTLTGSGTCIRGGEFCPLADEGQPGTDAEGRTYICEDKTHTGRDHWESP